MTVSVWSYDDLSADDGERHEPDVNPYVDCEECEKSYSYQDYWKPRYVDPDHIDSHVATWRCDECQQIYDRREQNESLERYVSEGIGR